MAKRCFKISGNFQQGGEWSQPDPGFIGYILVDEYGVFEGYTEELYATSNDKFRLVAGVFVDDSKLVFYKLIASSDFAPLMYVYKNGISELGDWVAFDSDGAHKGGSAKINLERIDDTPSIALETIAETKEAVLNDGVEDWNGDLFSRASELIGIFG